MKKVAVIGSFIVDLMARTPHLPEPGETVMEAFLRLDREVKEGIRQWLPSGQEAIWYTPQRLVRTALQRLPGPPLRKRDFHGLCV